MGTLRPIIDRLLHLVNHGLAESVKWQLREEVRNPNPNLSPALQDGLALIIRGIAEEEIPRLKKGLRGEWKAEFEKQLKSTEDITGIKGGIYNWKSTSPLCVHGDYSGAQATHKPNHNSTITQPNHHYP